MPISSEQIKLLESYRDKAYITSILCSQSAEHFSFLRSIVNIPLILSSSTMTVLNSMSEGNDNKMKFANIILNAWTSLILSLVGNFKLPEQFTNFAQSQLKFNSLCHQIEDRLSIDLENTNIEHIRAIINDYDALYEQLDYSFPNFIKNRVKKIYFGNRTLPNVLNCQQVFAIPPSLDSEV